MWESNSKRRNVRCNVNTNSAYLEVGFLAQKELPQQDLDPFLKSLLAQQFRARTSKQYTAAALAYLRHYQECLRLWDSLKYLLDDDWASQVEAKTAFMYAATGWRSGTAS